MHHLVIEKVILNNKWSYFSGGFAPCPPTRLSLVPTGGLTMPQNPQLIFKCSCFALMVRNGAPKLSHGYATDLEL